MLEPVTHLAKSLVPFNLLGVLGEFLPLLWGEIILYPKASDSLFLTEHNYNVMIVIQLARLPSLLFILSICLPDLPQQKSLQADYTLCVEVFPSIYFNFLTVNFIERLLVLISWTGVKKTSFYSHECLSLHPLFLPSLPEGLSDRRSWNHDVLPGLHISFSQSNFAALVFNYLYFSMPLVEKVTA